MSTSLLQIAKQFAAEGEICNVKKFGGGLINDTYRVSTLSKKHRHFILQRINSEVFPKPQWVMENLRTLLDHINKSSDQRAQLTFPKLITTHSGQLIYHDNKQQFWRAISYIENSQSFEEIAQASDAEQVGSALGEFHRRVCDLPVASLHDTLPGFHITPYYLAEYQQIKLVKLKSPEMRFCREFIAQYQQQADVLETAKRQGLLAVRVIHGDPKLNDLLFCKTRRQAISIIDLDTIKPGLVHYDIGDCLRSCCQTDNPVRFDLDICNLILSCYLEQTRDFFTAHDYDYLYPAIQLLPFELGLRFFSDYLQGNRYFKVSEPKQNLHRACRQFQLMQSIQRQQKEIEGLVNSLKKCNLSNH